MAIYMAKQVALILEAYKAVKSDLSIDQFALVWITENAASFRKENAHLLQ